MGLAMGYLQLRAQARQQQGREYRNSLQKKKLSWEIVSNLSSDYDRTRHFL